MPLDFQNELSAFCNSNCITVCKLHVLLDALLTVKLFMTSSGKGARPQLSNLLLRIWPPLRALRGSVDALVGRPPRSTGPFNRRCRTKD